MRSTLSINSGFSFHGCIDNTPLSQLEVLAVDCQATSANPDTGLLLEIGFMAGSAAKAIDVNDVRSHLIRQQEDMAPPAHLNSAL